MKYWWKPYEALMETKPVPAIDVLVTMIAKEAAEMCFHYPPKAHEIEWIDMRLKKRLSDNLADAPKIDLGQVKLIEQLVLWDLEHEIEAIDHFFRNDLHREIADSAEKVDALHFLWRGILEMFSMRKEESKRTLNAKHLRASALQISEEFLKLKRREA